MRRLVLLLLVAVVTAGCALPEPQPATPTGTPTATPTSTPPITTTPVTPTGAPLSIPRFEGGRAFAHVEAQVVSANGTPLYRIPATPGNDVVASYIADTLRALDYDVSLHHFSAMYGCELTSMHNVIAERAGSSGRIVGFAAHYDTRPIADKDPDTSRRDEPVLGANDGASGVAVLLELARVLPPSNDTVRFLFFDGEDGGGRWGGCVNEWILGSRAYASSLSASEVARFDALVLVDMVGDPHLTLPREGHSAADARSAPLQSEIYASAKRLGHDAFLDEIGQSILDDHVPFMERMVPAVDLIHLIPGDPRVFPAWHHTLADDLSSVSPDSLAAVGSTLEAWFAQRGRSQP